jgi:hypothetical protein
LLVLHVFFPRFEFSWSYIYKTVLISSVPSFPVIHGSHSIEH